MERWNNLDSRCETWNISHENVRNLENLRGKTRQFVIMINDLYDEHSEMSHYATEKIDDTDNKESCWHGDKEIPFDERCRDWRAACSMPWDQSWVPSWKHEIWFSSTYYTKQFDCYVIAMILILNLLNGVRQTWKQQYERKYGNKWWWHRQWHSQHI